MSWTDVQTRLTPEQMDAAVEEAARDLIQLPFAVLRNRRELSTRANQAVQRAIRRLGLPQPTAAQIHAMAAQVVARVGGLGFLDALLPPNTHEYTDIAVNPDGSVWVRRKGQMYFERLDIHPTVEEVWRAVDALLAPVGRACTEATPVVDARLPRDPEHGFAGARVNVTHPVITPGEGYPSIDIRLYEPRPVPPEQIVAWRVMPPGVMEDLLAAVGRRLRLMVIGGTATGKTTLLSALCHGIPRDARIVKIEDPEEIWLSHPNVETLEARHAPPGSDVRPFTVADGVDVALRLPHHRGRGAGRPRGPGPVPRTDDRPRGHDHLPRGGAGGGGAPHGGHPVRRRTGARGRGQGALLPGRGLGRAGGLAKRRPKTRRRLGGGRVQRGECEIPPPVGAGGRASARP